MALSEIPGAVARVGMVVLATVAVAGLALWIAGFRAGASWRQRGVLLVAAATLGSALLGGVVLLLSPLAVTPDAWWLALILIPAGVLTIAMTVSFARYAVSILHDVSPK